MIRSMTGYGRCEVSREEGSFLVEVKTLNHRYLDISIRMPGVLNPLEMKMRDYLKSRFSRGKVDVFVGYKPEDGKSILLQLNEKVVRQYMSVLERAKEIFGISGEVSLQDLFGMKEAIVVEEDSLDVEKVEFLLMDCLRSACDEAVEMREREGKYIHKVLRKLMKEVGSVVSNISAESHQSKESKIEKMRERVESLISRNMVPKGHLDKERLMTEVALILDRFDISEEVDRLRSHLEQFAKALRVRKGSVGRKLDFIIQEVNREFNTIGSKCQDADISSFVVEGKSILEKMREQIQNVE